MVKKCFWQKKGVYYVTLNNKMPFFSTKVRSFFKITYNIYTNATLSYKLYLTLLPFSLFSY